MGEIIKLVFWVWVGLALVRASRMKNGKPRDTIANIYLLLGCAMLAWGAWIVVAAFILSASRK